jgi:hypothetical protein
MLLIKLTSLKVNSSDYILYKELFTVFLLCRHRCRGFKQGFMMQTIRNKKFGLKTTV